MKSGVKEEQEENNKCAASSHNTVSSTISTQQRNRKAKKTDLWVTETVYIYRKLSECSIPLLGETSNNSFEFVYHWYIIVYHVYHCTIVYMSLVIYFDKKEEKIRNGYSF